MKKALSLLGAAALAVLVLSCTGPDTPAKIYNAPSMPGATELSASGATSSPADQTAAVDLYGETMGAVGDFLGSLTASRALYSAKATTPIGPETISYSGIGPNGDGTVTVNGTMSGSLTMPDDMSAPGTYHMSEVLNVAVTASITNASFDYGIHTYTITSGSLDVTEDVNLDIDLVIAADSSCTASMDLEFGIAYGTTFSVRRDDGLGAKFVLTYGAGYNVADLSVDADFETALASYLSSENVTLSVYDDANALIYSGSIPLDQLSSSIGI